VVQRVPVKIVFDESLPANHVLGPGLSVTPSVEISTFVFPAWASALLAVALAWLTALIVLFLGRKPAPEK
jgi:membrane fusion protein (multidrug efflux system)